MTGVIAGDMFFSASRGEVPVWSAGVGPVDGLEGVESTIGLRDDRVTAPLLHPEICCVPLYLPADGFPGCVDGTEPECCAALGDELCCGEDELAAGITRWRGAEGWIINSDIFSSFSTFLYAFLTHTVRPGPVTRP